MDVPGAVMSLVLPMIMLCPTQALAGRLHAGQRTDGPSPSSASMSSWCCGLRADASAPASPRGHA